MSSRLQCKQDTRLVKAILSSGPGMPLLIQLPLQLVRQHLQHKWPMLKGTPSETSISQHHHSSGTNQTVQHSAIRCTVESGGSKASELFRLAVSSICFCSRVCTCSWSSVPPLRDTISPHASGFHSSNDFLLGKSPIGA